MVKWDGLHHVSISGIMVVSGNPFMPLAVSVFSRPSSSLLFFSELIATEARAGSTSTSSVSPEAINEESYVPPSLGTRAVLFEAFHSECVG